MQCQACQKKLPPDRLKCPHCGEWQGAKKDDKRNDGSILLSDVVSSDIDRLQTGPWDECWGTDYNTGKQGIARCSTTLLSGSPGAGKSTLILQIADAAVKETKEESLYLAGEEPLEQIKARADRLGIKWRNRIRMLSLMTGEGNAEDLIAQYKPGFVIVDSLTSIAGTDQEKAVTVAKAIKVFSMRYRVAAIMTCQVTKSGDFAGLEKLQHEVDATMSFFPDESIDVPKGEEKVRILEVLKNRCGRAFIHKHFAMTERGLEVIELPDDDEEDEEE
jgi:DNA repair protein RadA/Sms